MSYDTIKARNQKPETRNQQSGEDKERGKFLVRLDCAEVEVTDFEARFIESFLNGPFAWTPARRNTCDQMRKTYGGRL